MSFRVQPPEGIDPAALLSGLDAGGAPDDFEGGNATGLELGSGGIALQEGEDGDGLAAPGEEGEIDIADLADDADVVNVPAAGAAFGTRFGSLNLGTGFF